MKFFAYTLIACAVSAGMLARDTDPNLDAYTAKLQAAKSLKVEFTNGHVGDKWSLTYSSPNKLKIETPDDLTISDGTILWVLNKKANTYTESSASLARALADDLLPWRGFFSNTPFKSASDVAAGADRTMGGTAVRPVSFSLSGQRKATLYIEISTGLVKGYTVMGGKAVITLVVSKTEIGQVPLAASEFAFTPPADAKKVEKPVAAVGSYAAVDAVFQQYCVGCHQPGSRKGGIDLSTYAATMQGGRSGPAVVPGDAANSLLVQYVKGTATPRMPLRADPLPAEAIKTIEDWIQAGAKNQ